MPYWDTTFHEQEHNSCASLSPLLYIRPVLARDRESATPAMLFPPRKVFEDFTWNCSIVCVQRYQNAKTPVRKDHEADCLELLFKCSDSPACTNNVYSQGSHPPRPVIKRPISLQSSDSLQAALHVRHGEILSCGSYQVNASPPNS